VPLWLIEPTHLGGFICPNANFLAIGAGVIVLIGLELFLALTRYGIIIRAGVEIAKWCARSGLTSVERSPLSSSSVGPWPGSRHPVHHCLQWRSRVAQPG